ncbi:hypothetical protein MACH09_04040 [Vibrio sp. MACH09]|uniref:aminoacyl-tRNA deacylase n=1 Tax=Vibrio sp. MACH09 TaxID=3025122 RepID=UPI0027913ABB|nr:YbaK/EbsC family protein [Vibrio sp. MACH09]GLO59896.1 hypothetical protein MACH09_04040 [Vibrio sp. MACH09]
MNNISFQTAITQYLEKQQVKFRLLLHTVPTTNIEETAKERNIEPRVMVKSILLRDMGNNYVLACIPGDHSVDPKKVRALLGLRRMTCVSYDDIEAISGYKPGTVSPLLLKTPMPIVFDQRFQSIAEITISSGSNMAGIAILNSDLFSLCNPTSVNADICR